MKKVLFSLLLMFCFGSIVEVVESIPATAQVSINYSDASGTVGTDLRQALASNSSRSFFFIQNVSASNILAFTVDNTVPGVNKAGSIQLAAGAFLQFSTKAPTGVINVIGSASNTAYTIKYEN
jgi:hypothetical protein